MADYIVKVVETWVVRIVGASNFEEAQEKAKNVVAKHQVYRGFCDLESRNVLSVAKKVENNGP